ncbi:MAG: MFS transporter [Acidobacteriota bacterium]|nr:MFS transporter [Acidobacteriota bacterium]
MPTNSPATEAPPDPAAASPALDPELPQLLSVGAVLRISLLRRLWYAQVISVFGDFLVLFAVIGVLTFRLHATAGQITGVQVSYLLPIAILGVIAGVFVDRWPVKPTLVASDAVRAGLVLLLLLATRLWHYYAVLAAISVVSSFFAPAQGVAIRSAVPAHGLRAANALMQQVMFGMRILGPAVAAFLVGAFGPISCYLADSASFVGSALLIASVAFNLPPKAPPQPVPGAPQPAALARIWIDMKQGIDFIAHHASLLFVILALASGMFVIGCFGPLIAVYVRDNLHSSTRVFGLASALIGVGMLVGINLLTAVAKNLKSSTLVYSGLAGIAAGLTFLAATAHVWSTFLGNFVIGLAVAGIVIPSQTLIQQETPPPLMGRVGSTVMSLVFTAQISGLLLSGVLAASIGVRQVFAVCAVLLAVLIAVGRLWMEPKERGQGEAPSR